MKTRSSWTTAFIYIASAVVVLLSVYPFVYAISTSLKTGTALFNTEIFPSQADLRNYYALFEGVQPFGKSLLNSVMVAVLTVGFAMLMGVSAAYALGRIRFKGKGRFRISR
jgi:trehalose/maltose transport system permease protein